LKTGEKVMKTFVRSLLFTAVLAVGANGLMAGTIGSGPATLNQVIKHTKALEAKAESQADHRTLAADYRQLAQRQLEESKKWADVTAWYARFPIYSSEKLRRSTIDRSEYFAERYRQDARQSERLANQHEALAG
jgi:hypothetical protein